MPRKLTTSEAMAKCEKLGLPTSLNRDEMIATLKAAKEAAKEKPPAED